MMSSFENLDSGLVEYDGDSQSDSDSKPSSSKLPVANVRTFIPLAVILFPSLLAVVSRSDRINR